VEAVPGPEFQERSQFYGQIIRGTEHTYEVPFAEVFVRPIASLQKWRRQNDTVLLPGDRTDFVGGSMVIRAEPACTNDATVPSPTPADKEQISAQVQQTDEAQSQESGRSAAHEIDLEAQAIALLFKHNSWSLAQIADYLKVTRQTLYKWTSFRKAAELDGRLKPRAAKDRTPPRGYKTRDGQVEAYANDNEH
jgi:hypothetical protein